VLVRGLQIHAAVSSGPRLASWGLRYPTPLTYPPDTFVSIVEVIVRKRSYIIDKSCSIGQAAGRASDADLKSG
jgi:hypothetical protein